MMHPQFWQLFDPDDSVLYQSFADPELGVYIKEVKIKKSSSDVN
jgi:hypothetical protein